jgi:hypothetical protein
MSACEYDFKQACIHTCELNTCIHAYMCKCILSWQAANTRTHTQRKHSHTHRSTHKHTHARTHTHTHTNAHMHTHTHTCTHTLSASAPASVGTRIINTEMGWQCMHADFCSCTSNRALSLDRALFRGKHMPGIRFHGTPWRLFALLSWGRGALQALKENCDHCLKENMKRTYTKRTHTHTRTHTLVRPQTPAHSHTKHTHTPKQNTHTHTHTHTGHTHTHTSIKTHIQTNKTNT